MPERPPFLTDRENIDLIIKDREQKLMEMKVQEWVYQGEVADPKNISKTLAMEHVATFQKRMRYLKEEIELYHQYKEEHDI